MTPALVQVLAALLFTIGLTVAISRRNVFFLLMGIELMLNAANLSLVGFCRTMAGLVAAQGQAAVVLIITLAAAEACVALAMVIVLARTRRTVDSDAIASLEG